MGAIPEYGRFDDLLALLGTPCENGALAYIRKQLSTDLEALENGRDVSLLATWLPSVNASNPQTVQCAKHVARALGMNDAGYRLSLIHI